MSIIRTSDGLLLSEVRFHDENFDNLFHLFSFDDNADASGTDSSDSSNDEGGICSENGASANADSNGWIYDCLNSFDNDDKPIPLKVGLYSDQYLDVVSLSSLIVLQRILPLVLQSILHSLTVLHWKR